MPSPQELLGEARSYVTRPDAPAAVWSRAAAVLARQALDQAIARLWIELDRPGMLDASMTTQLLCLRDPLGAAPEEAEALYTWSALSSACHHHAYEFQPTRDELTRLIDSVERIVTHLTGVCERRRRARQPAA